MLDKRAHFCGVRNDTNLLPDIRMKLNNNSVAG